MSTTHSSTPTPSPRRSRLGLPHRIVGGALAASVVTAVTLVAWPASAAETARDDGERLGAAVATLYEAETAEQANDALADVQRAADDVREHSSEELDEQIDDQVDALDRTVDGFVGMHTTDSDWDAELYEAELDAAVDDLAEQAEEFRTQAPEVVDAFWDGFDEGLSEGLETTDA